LKAFDCPSGTPKLSAAELTSGSLSTLRISSSPKARTFSSVSYFDQLSATPAVSTLSVRKPASTCCSFQKLRSIRPAAISSMNEKATCEITSRLRARRLCVPPPARVLSSFITSASSGRAVSAGSAPNSMPVRTETASVKASTGPSMPTSLARVVKRAVKATSRSRPAAASASPITPPISASSVLSVSSWRTSRPRPAPSAARIASSRLRRSMRDSIRFATLAQAISSTQPTAPSSTKSVGRARSVSSSPRLVAEAVKPEPRG
jgi:hypothetical protein